MVSTKTTSSTTSWDVFSDQEEIVLIWLAVSLNTLNLLGSLFILISVMLFSKLRRAFAFKLIIALAISNIGLEITYLIEGHNVFSTPVCFAKGWMRLYFTLTGLFVTTVIMATCYRLIIKNDSTIQESYWKMMVICWGIPIGMTLLPLISKNYDSINSDAWCSISGMVDTSLEYEGELWGLFLLYIPLWITVIANFWMLFSVSEAILRLENITHRIGTTTPDIPGGNHQCPSSTSYGALEDSSTICSPMEPGPPTGKSRTFEIINLLRLYPVALCVCYSWATVNRIYELITNSQSPFWLYVLQYIFMALNGAANAFIFLLTPPVLEEWVVLYRQKRQSLLFPWRRREGKSP